MNGKFVNIGKEGVKQLLPFFSLRISGVGVGIFSISPTKWDKTKVPYNDVYVQIAALGWEWNQNYDIYVKRCIYLSALKSSFSHNKWQD